LSSLLLIVPLFCVVILNLPFGSAMQRALKACPVVLSLGQVGLALFPRAGWWSLEDGGIMLLPAGVDNLSMLMILSIGLVLLASSFIGAAVIRDERGRHEFSALLLISMTGMNGVVLVKDIFSLYVFLEIVSVTSFILIAFRRERDALEGSFKYIVLSSIASVMMLTAIGIFFLISGGTGFDILARSLSANRDNFLVMFGVLMFIAGLLIKGGVVPFHGWLPDAYSSAPSPVSILLAGIVTKVSGVYTIIRLVSEVFGFTPKTNQVLLFTGALSIVAGALAAMGQKDFKRMLAYSSISQVGYIILSLGAGTTLGIAGAVFHLFNHAIFKSQLFMNATAVEMQTGSRDLDRMGGLGARMPITSTTSVIAFLSAAGIPPLAGFWSKLVIAVALWKSGHAGYMAVAILSSLLTLAYFLILQRRLFFGKPQPESQAIREAGSLVTFPSILFASIIVAVGVSIPFIYETIILPIGRIL
jgi:multicomponent Na+:H+ antiporter subunit D